MLLNQKIKLRSFWRVIFFLPVVISTGPVISELMGQGATSIPMLANSSFVRFMNEYLPTFIARPVSLLFEKLIIVLWFSGIRFSSFGRFAKTRQSNYESGCHRRSFTLANILENHPAGHQTVYSAECRLYDCVPVVFDMPTNPGEYTILSYIRAQSFEMGRQVTVTAVPRELFTCC